MNQTNLLISIAACLVSGILFSYGTLTLIVNLCRRYGLVDSPNWRKVHQVAIPRLGGLIFMPSLAISLVIGMGVLTMLGSFDYEFTVSTFAMVAGAILIYVIGLSDDLQEMKATTKFLVQIAASLLFPLCNLMVCNLQGFCGIYELPLWISYPLTVFIILLIVNAMNLIDGIDGLSSGLSILILAVLGVSYFQCHSVLFVLLCVSMIATLGVFFCFNVFGAPRGKKIFMGDAGSLTLGYVIAYLVIKLQMNEWTNGFSNATSLIVAYSLVIIPTFDVIRVALTRKIKGKQMFAPDKTHIHHKLMKSGIYMHRTLMVILCAAAFFFALNLLLHHLGTGITFIVIADVVLYAAWNIYIDKAIIRYNERITNEEDLRCRFQKNAGEAHKICILTPRFPVPENGGDVLRINNIARQLRKQGYEIVLISFEDDGAPQLFEAQQIYHKIYTVHRSKISSLIHAALAFLTAQPIQCGYYASSRFSQMLNKVIEKEQPDIFIAHLLRMMPYLDSLGLHDRSIIEMTDALSKTYALSDGGKGNNLLRFVYRLEEKLILRAEQYALMHFPKNVLVSASDIEYLSTKSNHPGSMELHTNGIDCMSQLPQSYDPNKIVFVGNMRTLQNQDAVLFFVEKIFPKILKQRPDTRFYIVGAQPSRVIQELADDNIIVTGFVEDLGATIGDACLAVAPVKVAAGIQNKVLVSMGCGIPVVLTPLIAKAIPELKHEENCMIQEGASAFAEDCLRIMRHSELRQQLADAGYDVVKQHYSWTEKIRGYVI